VWCDAARIQNLGWPRLLCWQGMLCEPVDLMSFWALEVLQSPLLDPVGSCTQGQPFCLRRALLSSPSCETAIAKDRAFVYFLSVKVQFLKRTAAHPHCVCWLYLCLAVEHCSSFNPLKPRGHYIYQHFNIQQFYVLLWISEQTAIISVYNINWLVCIAKTECVYCAVRTGSLNKAVCACLYRVKEKCLQLGTDWAFK